MFKEILSLTPTLLMGALLAAAIGSGAVDRTEARDARRTSPEQTRQHINAAPPAPDAAGMASGAAHAVIIINIRAHRPRTTLI